MQRANYKTRVLMYFLLFFITIFIAIVSILLSVGYIKALPFVSYFINSLAFCLLCFSIYILISRFKMIKNEILNVLIKHNFTRKIVKEYDFRTIIISLGSLIINLVFLSYYLGYTIFNYSIWYLSLSVFYALLFFAREITIYNYYKYPNNKEKQIKVHAVAGLLLCFLPLYLFVAAKETSNQVNHFKYPIIHIIVISSITFYKLTMGIYNAIKAHRRQDLIVISLRNINLAEALASLVALSSTLLLFEASDKKFVTTMMANIVFITTIVTLFLGVSMIKRTIYERKKIRWEAGISGLENFYSNRKH